MLFVGGVNLPLLRVTLYSVDCHISGDIMLPPVPFLYSEDLERAKAQALAILDEIEIEDIVGESVDITILRDRIVDLSNYLAFCELNVLLYEFAADHPEVKNRVREIVKILREAIL
jgi:hypothetical protein